MCSLFTDCISKLNKRQVSDNAKDIDVVMPIYNLIEYSNNYSKTLGSLWQYYRDEPTLTAASTIDNFPGNSTLFKFKQKRTGQTDATGTKDVAIEIFE